MKNNNEIKPITPALEADAKTFTAYPNATHALTCPYNDVIWVGSLEACEAFDQALTWAHFDNGKPSDRLIMSLKG